MTAEKQVSFIERVSKSILGLEGLQIVVYSDRARKGFLTSKEKEACTFFDIGKKILSEVNGEYIKKNYNLLNGTEFKEKLHEERVKWIKNKCIKE